jgi:hypothetical protein
MGVAPGFADLNLRSWDACRVVPHHMHSRTITRESRLAFWAINMSIMPIRRKSTFLIYRDDRWAPGTEDAIG